MEKALRARRQRVEMIELATENRYGAAFQHLLHTRRDEAAWLRTAREEAFRKFERVGFPTVRDEDWKYTNLAPVARGQFAPVIQNGSSASLKSDVDKSSYP